LSDPTPKRDVPVDILANGPVAPGFYRCVVGLEGAKSAFAPGQFFQLRVQPGGLDPLLRRPFAPSEIEDDYLAFVYAVVGRGTELLSGLSSGDRVEILYPLGNGWSRPQPGEAALLVGGGCGTPSLLVWAQALVEAGHPVYVATGARSDSVLLEADALQQIATGMAVATDDGSTGRQGHAVDAAIGLIDEIPVGTPLRLYGCGPEPMLRGLCRLAAERDLPCEVSLEVRMACGFGACVGCVVPIRDAEAPEGFRYRKACQDGPVFDASTILWEETPDDGCRA
jgi:dihydroorotate dehydrogenase electron transfer subunit